MAADPNLYESSPPPFLEFLEGPATAFVLLGDYDFVRPFSRPGFLRSSEIIASTVLSPVQIDQTRALLRSVETYGNMPDRCFVPRFGFTFGPGPESIDVLICVSCRWSYFFKGSSRDTAEVLSEVATERLIALHQELFPDHNPTPKFDRVRQVWT